VIAALAGTATPLRSCWPSGQPVPLHPWLRSVWSARLALPSNSTTIVAEDESGLVGFGHVFFDDDRWDSFIENLHVTHDRRRSGIGRTLLTCVAGAVAERATGQVPVSVGARAEHCRAAFLSGHGWHQRRKSERPTSGGVPARLTNTVSTSMPWARAAWACSWGRAAGGSCPQPGARRGPAGRFSVTVIWLPALTSVGKVLTKAALS
jgi:GNAT superfamily N-acetyltransferase